MKIRAKRTTLLLCFALLPITLLFILHANSMRKTRNHITSETRVLLESNAKHHLQTVVNDFGRITQRDRIAAEQALTIMAKQIEDTLAGKNNPKVKPYFVKDYENPQTAPADLTTSEYYHKTVKGEEQAIPVSLSNVVFFLTAGTHRDSVIGDINKLVSMGKPCEKIRKSNPGGMTWLYAGFENGFFMSYPGHGGYPENYDPRKRLWYQDAKTKGTRVWTLLSDVSTRKVGLTISKPIKYPSGKFAGVAAIDIGMTQILDIVNLPAEWKASAVILQVTPNTQGSEASQEGDPKAGPGERLLIVAQESYVAKGEDWEKPVEWEYLTSPDKVQLDAMKADILAGRPGIRRMRLKDRDTIWAYGKWEQNQPIPVVVVPYDRVVAQAAKTEKFMLDEFKGVATFVSVLLIVVFIAAIVAAMISAQAVTKPISQLAGAACELSEGNFEAQTDIRTGDELQDLGEVFNSMGPKLLAEQNMRRSLEIAREIQQRLLPQSNPKMDGFDIAGATIYCDETGGDYYDFIDLSEKKPGVLGLALGDITGHGIQAALLMATARGILRSHAMDHFDKLDKLMEDINEPLVADTDAAHFLTLFYAILDPENKTIKCVSAGHDPAFWLHKSDGEFGELGEASGVMLGVLEGVTYDDSEPVKLSSGDVILIGTDGIWEARGPDRQQFEKDRLQEIIRSNAHKPAMEIIDAVNNAVAEYRGGTPQEDDITMIVIKVL